MMTYSRIGSPQAQQFTGYNAPVTMPEQMIFDVSPDVMTVLQRIADAPPAQPASVDVHIDLSQIAKAIAEKQTRISVEPNITVQPAPVVINFDNLLLPAWCIAAVLAANLVMGLYGLYH